MLFSKEKVQYFGVILKKLKLKMGGAHQNRHFKLKITGFGWFFPAAILYLVLQHLPDFPRDKKLCKLAKYFFQNSKKIISKIKFQIKINQALAPIAKHLRTHFQSL
jgi:hypothetical protein